MKERPGIFKTLAIALMLVLPKAGMAAHAYLLDAGGVGDVEELYLLGALQGIVNRDAPRLFLSGVDSTWCAGADNVYVDYLEKEKGFTFIRLKSLGEAISTFAAMKRADGVTPLIKGLIKYPTTCLDATGKKRVNAYFNSWIAANFAAQEDLLPVTDKILQCQTPTLSGSMYWNKDEVLMGWKPMYAVMKKAPAGGVSLEMRPGAPARKSAFVSRWVYLDLDKTPKIEMVVSEITPGGSCSLIIGSPTSVHTFETGNGVKVPGLTNIDHAGTVVVDLAATGLFRPRSGMACLRIELSGPGVSATIKSVRLLDAGGREPSAVAYVPDKNVFNGLAVKRDLTTGSPYPQNEEGACEWSLANQRKQCDPGSFGSFAAGSWILKGLDYAIAKKVYLFYQNKQPIFKGGYPNLDKILADLKPPALVYGWLGEESPSCMKMGQFGARYAGGPPENFSFWQWVPLKEPGKPVPLPQNREVKNLENKIYLNFSWASADYIQFSYQLMEGYWEDPNRGKVPITWGFNPMLARFAPAIVEFFARTATPKDSFWAFTAGYTHLSCFSPANLKLYADETRRGIRDLGISPAVDVWDSWRNCARVYEELSKDSPSSPGIKLMSVLPTSHGPETTWLENGAAVVRMDERFHGKSQRNGKVTPESLVADVKAIAAQYPGKNPIFLTCNTRVSPTFAKKVQDNLPSNVQIVGMPDFIGLVEEAGAVVALPFSDSVGSGDSIKVSFELHNASGATGGAGTVTWTLPAGWKSSPAQWSHGPVPAGSNLKQVVTFTPPAGMTSGTVSVGYKDSRFPWEKEFSLATLPGSVTASDCESLAGWTAAGGASLAMDRGMVRITPRVTRSRCDFFDLGRVKENNGRVTFPLGQVDFGRKPLLKVKIAEQDGAGTILGLLDENGQWKKCSETGDEGTVSIDLASVTKWAGAKPVTLTLDPLTDFGSLARIRSIKVCYP